MAANTVISSTVQIRADTSAARKDVESLLTNVNKLAG
jgi:hypothetical protein